MDKATQPISSCRFREKSTLLIISILVLALLARLAFVMIYRGGDFNPDNGMKSWPRIALSMASGEGYVYDSQAPTARRGPVPILFMVLLFSLLGPKAFPVPMVVCQWMWDAGSTLLIYYIAMELFGRRRVAIVAMILFALHPVIIENSVRVNVEPLATFLLLAFVQTFLRAWHHPHWTRFIGPGLLLGLAILSLASLQFFPALAVGLIIMNLHTEKRKAIAAIGVFCLSLFVVWAPWVVRNYLALGAFVPASTLGGLNLIEDHFTLGDADYLWQEGHYSEELEASISAATGIDVRHLSEIERDRLFRQVSLDLIRTYPDRYIALSLVRFFRLWFNQGFGLEPDRLGWAAVLVNGSLMFLALVAYVCFRGAWTRPVLLLSTLLVYMTGLSMAVAAEIRYSIPFTPLLIVLSAYALVNVVVKLWSSRKFGLRLL